MPQQLSMEMLAPEQKKEIEEAFKDYKPATLPPTEKAPEVQTTNQWPAPDFHELDPEKREQQENYSLQYQWQNAGVLYEGDPVVVVNSTGACEIGNMQNDAQGMPSSEVIALNNPIKTAEDWYSIRWRITGSNVVKNPDKIDGRLMTPEKFMEEVKGIQTDKQSEWLDVVNRFDQNLQMLEHAIKNPQ